MEARVNYTLVGLFVVILTAAAFAVGFWLTAGRHNKTYHNYLVYMNEAVSGLSEQSLVKYSGVQVGFVETIELDAANPQRVRILLAIVGDTPITTTTRAMLMSQGITGIAYIGLEAKTSDAPPLLATVGEPYPVIPTNPSLFVQLDKAVREITENISNLSGGISSFFTEQSGHDFKTVLANMNRITSRLDLTVDKADRFLDNATRVSDAFPDTTQEFRQTLAIMRQASKATEEFMAAGKRTADIINQQAVPPAVGLVKRLDKLAVSVDKLSNEISQNPGILVRGKAPARPGPGEK